MLKRSFHVDGCAGFGLRVRFTDLELALWSNLLEPRDRQPFNTRLQSCTRPTLRLVEPTMRLCAQGTLRRPLACPALER